MTAESVQDRFRVLLPNEQEQWHAVVRQLLAPQGIRTVSARNGREALDLIENSRIDVAVLDYRMPQLGGMQVLRLLKDKGAAPPSILLADQLTNAVMQEALGMQVFSVLGKPVDFNLLLDALARAVRKYYESRWPGSDTAEH